MKNRMLLITWLAFASVSGNAQSLIFEDTRGSSTVPATYNSIFRPSFKFNTSLGLPNVESGYYSVLGLRAWGDNSGGKAHELAFGDNNEVYIRSGFDPSWAGWRKFLLQDINGNVNLNGNVNVNGNLRLNEIDKYYGAYYQTNDYSTMTFWSRAWATVQGTNGKAFSFQTHNNSGGGGFEMMAIYYGESGKIIMGHNGGNVGIGTSDPTEKLSVNGRIRAKEIKVEAAPWPDYVFHSSYHLPDLKATEQFIKENKHLPEIPSAAEVERDGVNLGEMNARLLRKIEELTLYVIDLKKENESQNQKILELQKSNHLNNK